MDKHTSTHTKTYIMKQFIFTTALLFIIGFARAQNVGIGTNTPDPSATLEIKCDSSGTLIPRMTDAQRTAINNPATGLLVFVTTDSAFYYFDGTARTTLYSRTLQSFATFKYEQECR